MTEALKTLGGKAPTWLALATSLATAIYAYGQLSATVEAQQRDIARLERQVAGLYRHVRRLNDWPSRAPSGSTKTDQQ